MTTPKSSDLGAVLESLALVVDGMEKRLTAVEARTECCVAQEDQTAATKALGTVKQLVEVVDKLDQRIAEIENSGSQSSLGETQSEMLADWVKEIRTTYCLGSKINEAWRDIPAVAVELQALWMAYHHAFGSEAKPFEQIYWHDALARVVPRIVEHQGQHRKSVQLR